MADPVLLIEDTPSLQMVYEAILNKSGYEVDCANTADEGARIFAGQQHPVVLLDLLLPDRDGLELMGDLLQAEPNTKVIVIRQTDRSTARCRQCAPGPLIFWSSRLTNKDCFPLLQMRSPI
jgi:DNA-binding response OmpR family regulator